MFKIRNKISRDLARKKLEQENTARKTVSFYKYTNIKDPLLMRNNLFIEWEKLGVLGRIYVAKEGINAQLSLPKKNWDKFVKQLYKHSEFFDIPFKVALEEPDISFTKLTIKVKNQIVADGLKEGEFDIKNVGNHLSPKEFHKKLQEEDTVVVDMRNHYESRIGHFENAICPDVDTFREELPVVKEILEDKKDKKILLYCTGGIRCEKASAYLKKQGFNDVNQLNGGIIDYAHYVKQNNIDSKFIGKNFVFDGRLAEKVTEEILSSCDQCDSVCDSYTNCANQMCNLLFIQCNTCSEKFNGACSNSCKEISLLPKEEQKQIRKKNQKPTNYKIFKSRQRPKKVLKKS